MNQADGDQDGESGTRGGWRHGLAPTPATEMDWLENRNLPDRKGVYRKQPRGGKPDDTFRGPDRRHGNGLRREMFRDGLCYRGTVERD